MWRLPMEYSTVRGRWSSARPSIDCRCKWLFCTACWPRDRAFDAENSHMILNRPDPSVAVRALKSAAPYIRMYKNKVFIIKAGGAVFSDEASTRGLIEQVAILHQVGIKTVLVHGGGPQLDSLQATLGIDTRMVNGRRVTDQKSIDVTAMVLNGFINPRILAICRELDIEAIGLSGFDAGRVRAHRRPPVRLGDGSNETVDYGFVGNIDSVNAGVIE